MLKPSIKTARRSVYSLIFIVLASCGTQKTATSAENKLYEILVESGSGGGNIQFYEILTTEREVGMLANDELLNRKVTPEEAKSATFLVLNMGEKPSSGYSIGIESVKEIPERIIVTLKEQEPEPGSMNLTVISYPYTVIKINSKKPVEIR